MHKKTRRMFLKESVAGAAGIAGTSLTALPEASPSVVRAMERINPAIPNLRVVCCSDPAMVTKKCSELRNFGRMSVQNGAVNKTAVHRNMDAMARVLTGSKSAAAAWKNIFQQPPGKKWSQVRIAIKVNAKPVNYPRLAVVEKVCLELNALGVPCSNIILFDGGHNAKPPYAATVGNGLPADLTVSDKNSLLGGTTNVKIPSPGSGSHGCTKDIANGNIDLLINIAVNKGHGRPEFGGATLTLKNHFGTFTPRHGTTEYMLGLNKSDAILGGTPPRQQLCIIDALWSATRGPGGSPNKDTHRLIMGTFSPAVDFACIRHVREKVMRAKHNANINKFATAFGYTTAQFDAMEWIEFKPDSEPTYIARSNHRHGGISLRWNRRELSLKVPGPGTRVEAALFSTDGRKHATLFSGRSVSNEIPIRVFDIADTKDLPKGRYLIKAIAGGHRIVQKVTIR